MILWLDHIIFGNGRGMKSPYFDDKFYWLVDEKWPRHWCCGELYNFSWGFGAQLHSIQWIHPKSGEERKLIGRRFKPLHSNRRWGRVEIAWSMADFPSDLSGQHAAINKLRSDLDSVLMEPAHDHDR